MTPYRTGNHQPQNVYRGDHYIGVMFTTEDAAEVVAALNEAERLAQLTRVVTEQLMPPRPAIEHRAETPGADGLGYGKCTGCGEMWPCKTSREDTP